MIVAPTLFVSPPYLVVHCVLQAHDSGQRFVIPNSEFNSSRPANHCPALKLDARPACPGFLSSHYLAVLNVFLGSPALLFTFPPLGMTGILVKA